MFELEHPCLPTSQHPLRRTAQSVPDGEVRLHGEREVRAISNEDTDGTSTKAKRLALSHEAFIVSQSG